MSNQGYVKLYRQIQDSAIWDDPYKLKLWLYCLLRASHTDTEILIENQVMKLKKGQFITGRNSLEAEFNKGISSKKRVTGYTLFRWLKLFENVQMLHIKKTSKYTIITVLNWDKYQNNAQQMHISCTTNAQQMHTNKNVKNDKNVKNIFNNKMNQSSFITNQDDLLNSWNEEEQFKPVDEDKLAEFERMLEELD